ncbi:flavodoxin family protein [Dactylosporangium sp. CA-139114]|uniref:flavodoxin family protein n=1 Tax=Dactylosporangium sp. CA-139114 TaxID=3239931 RepID=UPI003D997471
MTDTVAAPDVRRFLFVLGSSRAGNSEALARHAATALPADVEQDWKRLSELPLAAFSDTDHAEHPEPSGNERILLDATLDASDIVVVSPLYWYNVSASVKLYLDYWGGWMRRPQLRFRTRMQGKTMWAVTTTGVEDAVKAGPLLESLRLSAEYLGMRWGGDVVAHARRPGGILAEADALERARTLFQAGPAW